MPWYDNAGNVVDPSSGGNSVGFLGDSGAGLMSFGAGVVDQFAQGAGFGLTYGRNSAAVDYPPPAWAIRQTGGQPTYLYPPIVTAGAPGITGAPTSYPVGSNWPPAGRIASNPDIASYNPYAIGTEADQLQNLLGGNLKWVVIGLAILLFVAS